jgi:periplasmic copper chaperone A
MTATLQRKNRGRTATLGAAAVALILTATVAVADPHQVRQGDITIASRVVRASIAGSPNSAAYMVIVNGGAEPEKLLAARCACAASVDIHKTENMHGMSMMVSAAPVVIPAHGQATFRPGGLHLMLTHLKEPLVDGGQQEITLVFQHAGAMRVGFHIRAQIPGGAEAPMAGMGH